MSLSDADCGNGTLEGMLRVRTIYESNEPGESIGDQECEVVHIGEFVKQGTRAYHHRAPV